MYDASIGLIRLGGTSSVTGVEFPLKHIRYDTYKCTPAQRIDLNSGVSDTTGELHRTVLSHTRTKIEFNLHIMHESEYEADIASLLDAQWSNKHRAEIYLYYYDNRDRAYHSGKFYMPDPTFQIMNIDAKGIQYNETRLAFIEY